ncbi:hypothetical protein HAX54_007063 [Datura stramonium]|uniref:Secreted protein n=1 Tax=Datura stramonium TaxID=4076 RepID=A0ABS8TB87_DATST|nr:hypothetical protein [Datura stramonium]
MRKRKKKKDRNIALLAKVFLFYNCFAYFPVILGGSPLIGRSHKQGKKLGCSRSTKIMWCRQQHTTKGANFTETPGKSSILKSR